MPEILFKAESYRIIGACMKVHAELGHGFLTSPPALSQGKGAQEALEKQFKTENIPYQREKLLNIQFDNEQLKKYFKADFVCYNGIIVELKATKYLVEADYKQTLNNIKATRFKLGLLINFATPSLIYKRIIN